MNILGDRFIGRITFFVAALVFACSAQGFASVSSLPPGGNVTHGGADSIYCVGETINLVVSAYDPGVVTFQWQICSNVNLCPTDVDWSSVASPNNDSIDYVFVGAGVRRFRCRLITAVDTSFSGILNLFVENPTVTLNTGNLDTLCQNESRIFTATFAGATAATYAWTLNGASVGSNASTYTYSGSITAALQVVVNSTNNCPATSAILNFTPIAPPVVNAGSYTSICTTGTQTMSSASVSGTYSSYAWSSNSGGSFTNPPAPNNAVFTPAGAASPATLTLTVSSVACPNVIATATLIVVAPPTANAGAAASTCLTTPYNVNATVGGSFTTTAWTATSGTFNNAALEDPVFTPNPVQAANSFQSTLTLTVSSQFCANVISTLVLTINKPPVPNAGDDITICASGMASLNGTATGIFPVNAWSWSAPNGSGTFTPPTGNITSFDPTTVDGSVVLTFTVTSLECPPQTDDILVTVVPDPTVNSLTPIVICDDAIGAAITFTGTASSYSWTCFNPVGFGSSGNGNIPSYTASNEGNSALNATLVVTPVGAFCNGSTVEVMVTVNPSPEVNAISPQTICSGNQFEIEPASSVAGSSFNWTASSIDGLILEPASGVGPVSQVINNTINLSGEASFTFTASALGCSGATTTAIATVVALPAVTSITAPVSMICAGESVAIEIEVTGLPDFNGVLSLQTSDGTTVLNGTSVNNTLTFNVTPLDTTTYSMQSLTSSGVLGCSALGSGLLPSFYLEVNPRPVASFIDESIAICEGTNAIFDLIISAGQSPFSGLLSDGTAFTDLVSPVQLNLPITSPGATIGIESITDSHGCTAFAADISDEIIIDVIESPSATITTSPDVLCGNEDLLLTISGDGNGTVTYTVNNGNPQSLVLSAGTFELNLGSFPTLSQVIVNLTQISIPGIVPCVSTLSELDTVVIIPFPNTQNLFIDTSAAPFCQGSNDLQLWVNDNTPGLTWSWSSIPPLPMAFSSHSSNVFIDIPSNLTGAIQLTSTVIVNNLGHQCSSDIHEQIFVEPASAPVMPELILYPLGNTLVLLTNNANLNFQWGYTNDSSFVATPAVGETAQDWLVGTLNPNHLYWAMITDATTGCSTMAYYNGVGPIDVEEITESTLSIYPNPSTDRINVVPIGNASIREISIYDLSGRMIFNNSYLNRAQIVLDVHDYPVGFYALRARDESNQWKTFKFEVVTKH